jgi:hypothetical protein
MYFTKTIILINNWKTGLNPVISKTVKIVVCIVSILWAKISSTANPLTNLRQKSLIFKNKVRRNNFIFNNQFNIRFIPF